MTVSEAREEVKRGDSLVEEPIRAFDYEADT